MKLFVEPSKVLLSAMHFLPTCLVSSIARYGAVDPEMTGIMRATLAMLLGFWEYPAVLVVGG